MILIHWLMPESKELTSELLSTWQQAKLIHLKEHFGIPQMTCTCTTFFCWSLPAGFLDGPHQHKWLPPRGNRMSYQRGPATIFTVGSCNVAQNIGMQHVGFCTIWQNCWWRHDQGTILTQALIFCLQAYLWCFLECSSGIPSVAAKSNIFSRHALLQKGTLLLRSSTFLNFGTSPYMASEEVEIRKLIKIWIGTFPVCFKTAEFTLPVAFILPIIFFFGPCLGFSKLQQLFNVHRATCMPIHQGCSAKMIQTGWILKIGASNAEVYEE